MPFPANKASKCLSSTPYHPESLSRLKENPEKTLSFITEAVIYSLKREDRSKRAQIDPLSPSFSKGMFSIVGQL
jgi:hypothetical protein